MWNIREQKKSIVEFVHVRGSLGYTVLVCVCEDALEWWMPGSIDKVAGEGSVLGEIKGNEGDEVIDG